MTIAGLKLRSDRWSEFPVVLSGSSTAGAMDQIQNAVGVYAESKLTGQTVAFIYRADKIMLPKLTATGEVFVKGQIVYYVVASKKVSATKGSNLAVGICTADAAQADTEVEVDLNGKHPQNI